MAGKSSYMPSVTSLPPPDKLLLRPPYHMIVYGGHEVRVQCSHGPSLEFLASYLKKWCRANTRRSDKVSPVTLISCFPPYITTVPTGAKGPGDM